MCLGILGQLVAVAEPPDRPDLRTGTVDIDGVRREVSLACTPEAGIGDYVIVHAGFAVSTVDPEEAARTLALIRAIPDAPARQLDGGP